MGDVYPSSYNSLPQGNAKANNVCNRPKGYCIRILPRNGAGGEVRTLAKGYAMRYVFDGISVSKNQFDVLKWELKSKGIKVISVAKHGKYIAANVEHGFTVLIDADGNYQYVP